MFHSNISMFSSHLLNYWIVLTFMTFCSLAAPAFYRSTGKVLLIHLAWKSEALWAKLLWAKAVLANFKPDTCILRGKGSAELPLRMHSWSKGAGPVSYWKSLPKFLLFAPENACHSKCLFGEQLGGSAWDQHGALIWRHSSFEPHCCWKWPVTHTLLNKS